MTSRALAKKIAQITDGMKGENVLVLDLRRLTSFTDFFVVCSGSSDRQVLSIARAVHDDLKKEGRLPLGEEGMNSGRWALIDYGDVVAHVFHRDEREYYALEEFWNDAPRVAFKGITD